jgi:hypothetical protein
VKSFKRFYVSPKSSKEVEDVVSDYGMTSDELPNMVFMIDEDSDEFSEELKNNEMNSEVLKNYLEENKAKLSGKTLPKYFYEIEFEKPGGIVMPIIVEYSYADGSKEQVTYPVQVWRKNSQFVTKRIVSNKEIVKVVIDPKAKTADVNLSNNSWPKEELKSDFDKFKDSLKG